MLKLVGDYLVVTSMNEIIPALAKIVVESEIM